MQTTETLSPNHCETLEELRAAYGAWLAIEQDSEALDVVLAAMLDRHILGDPLWLFIVGPSGGAKSEILRSLCDLNWAYHLSNLTSKTIVSGKERKDGTIVQGLFREMDGHVVVIPELSQVLSRSREERDAIFAQFRDLYDGHCSNGYGTADKRIIVDCRIGLICGVTSAIDMYGSIHAVLGERFLKIRPKFNRDEARERALINKDRLEVMRVELKAAAERFFERIIARMSMPTISAERLGKISLYAEFVAQLRTTVTSQAFREYDTSEWQPEPEFATRLGQQLLKLGQALAILRGREKIKDEDLATVSRVAMDTCLPNRLAIVRALYLAKQPLSITELASKASLPYGKTRNSLEALTVIGGIIEETNAEREHNERFYKLTEKFHDLMDKITKESQNDGDL
jgi:predicted transcriptional regulator